ncbi:MAG: hypothetical protein MJZ81_07865 [Bacteroidales bacterium]|nr:hypothetical protein [Bacteroidales bacterium]
MDKYIVIKETNGIAFSRTPLHDVARKLNEAYDPDPITMKEFDTEAEAASFAMSQKSDLRIVDTFSGHEALYTFHTVLRSIRDEDGDEIDCEHIGSYDALSEEDIYNGLYEIMHGTDDEDEEEDE